MIFKEQDIQELKEYFELLLELEKTVVIEYNEDTLGEIQ
jgi:hypothetical protein